MKPPDRPTPGRTDRILGVMGGMLRACAVPGQEGVRRRDRGWGRGSLGGLQENCTPRLSLPANKSYMEQWQGSLSSLIKGIGQVLVEPFKIMRILTGGGGKGEVKGGPYSDSVPADPEERSLRAWEYRDRE